MSDIVKQLREFQDALGRPPEFDDVLTIGDDAADAIESLQAENAALKAEVSLWQGRSKEQAKIIVRLKADNQSLSESFDGIKNVLHNTQKELAAIKQGEPVAWMIKKDGEHYQLRYVKMLDADEHYEVIPLYLAAPVKND